MISYVLIWPDFEDGIFPTTLGKDPLVLKLFYSFEYLLKIGSKINVSQLFLRIGF